MRETSSALPFGGVYVTVRSPEAERLPFRWTFMVNSGGDGIPIAGAQSGTNESRAGVSKTAEAFTNAQAGKR